mmetsp:Transcript_14446/g.48875  ORF Transcript_14446/g.48875 Transcript_14446/m.48875 type:complete len:243 (-) Transcript_14446:138-866(-)
MRQRRLAILSPQRGRSLARLARGGPPCHAPLAGPRGLPLRCRLPGCLPRGRAQVRARGAVQHPPEQARPHVALRIARAQDHAVLAQEHLEALLQRRGHVQVHEHLHALAHAAHDAAIFRQAGGEVHVLPAHAVQALGEDGFEARAVRAVHGDGHLGGGLHAVEERRGVDGQGVTLVRPDEQPVGRPGGCAEREPALFVGLHDPADLPLGDAAAAELREGENVVEADEAVVGHAEPALPRRVA